MKHQDYEFHDDYPESLHATIDRLRAELVAERARSAKLAALCADLATTSDAMKLQLILNGCLIVPKKSEPGGA